MSLHDRLKFNKGLKAASKAGKLDKNPNFKAAVDNSPVAMKKSAMKMKKELLKCSYPGGRMELFYQRPCRMTQTLIY